MTNFAYSVAIKLSLANLASQGLKLFAGDLLGAHSAAVKLEDRVKALKLAAIGYGFDKLGQGLYGFMAKSVDASKEYTRQLSLMTSAGMAQRDIAQATAAAWQTSRDVVTSTAADNLKSIRELRSVLGVNHMGEAYAVLPIVQRTKAILEALTGKEQDNIAFEMVKAVDLRTAGVMSQASLTRNADLMGRTLMAMGGTLGVNDYLMTLKYAKTAALSFSDQFIYDYLPTLMQEVKGGGGGFMGNTSTAGTALMTLFNSVVQGGVKKAAVPVWEAMGLIKPSDVVANQTGGFQLKPGAVRGAAQFAENPFLWAQMITPAIDAYAKSHRLTELQAITAMGLPRNAAWVLTTMVQKAGQFQRDRTLIESGNSSMDTYQKLLQTNPQLAEEALHNQYQNILALIGYKILPRLIPYMVKFADGLDRIAQWMNYHPAKLEAIALGIGSVAVSFMVLGKAVEILALARFAGISVSLLGILTPIGLVTAAIVGIGAVAYEAYKHWTQIESFFHRIFDTSSIDGGGGGSTGAFTGVSGSWGAPNHTTVVHTQVHLDGKKVAQSVSKHQGAALSKPQTGISLFDSTVMPMLAGGGFGGM